MRVALGAIDVFDLERRAVAYHYGVSGLADHRLVRRFVLAKGTEALRDAVKTMDERFCLSFSTLPEEAS